MDAKNIASRRGRILQGIYSSSWGISMTALSVVAILEICMLVYSTINPPLYGPYLWKYRGFYISLLSVAAISIFLNIYVKRDIEHRYALLNIANPLCATFFFAWSLGITYSDVIIYNAVDATVFMTFSLIVPLSFFLFPTVYSLIVIVVDVVMLYLTAVVSQAVAPLINLSIFIVFQLVLGISFLRLKMKLAERIVEEQENADMDVLTGFPNRRFYEEDLKRLTEAPLPDRLVYIAADLNGLKEINDRYGHESGDKLIIGAARCIEHCFGDRGKMYRIGGDEFAVLISAGPDELVNLFNAFESSMKSWSERNGMPLSASYGYVCHAEYPDRGVTELAKLADERMYAAKARYYQANGANRRRYRAYSN